MGPERHPSALGQRGRECWGEIWHIIGPQIDQVMSGGGATWHENQLVPVTRHGALQQVYWTYGFSPIDEDDDIGGVLVVCRDVTTDYIAAAALREREAELARVSRSVASAASRSICEPAFAIAGHRNISPFTTCCPTRPMSSMRTGCGVSIPTIAR
jgi:hypothetical protein